MARKSASRRKAEGSSSSSSSSSSPSSSSSSSSTKQCSFSSSPNYTAPIDPRREDLQKEAQTKGESLQPAKYTLADLVKKKDNKPVFQKLIITSVMMILLPLLAFVATLRLSPIVSPSLSYDAVLALSGIVSTAVVLMLMIGYVIMAFNEEV